MGSRISAWMLALGAMTACADADDDGLGGSATDDDEAHRDDEDDDAGDGVPATNAELCNAVDDDDDGEVDEAGCPCPVFTHDGSSYMFCTQSRNWVTARDACAQYDYALVSIDSAAENDFLASTAEAVGWIAAWWIGLSDTTTETVFAWEDGAPLQWQNWGWNQPDNLFDEDCVEMVVGGRWNDLGCLLPHFYVCEG